MAGAALALGVLGVTASLVVGYGAVGVAAVRSARAGAAADAAALAAADTALGRMTGVPCTRAAEVAAAVGATVEECTVIGAVATVSVQVPAGLFSAHARARAGP